MTRLSIASPRLPGVVLFAISMLAANVCQAKPSKPSPSKPNVILVVIDTLRADHLSAYGYEKKTSPRIDALAADGVLYERSISASSWTLPSHASLFTGKFPRDHKTTSQNWELDESFDTLAELLRNAGYQTGGFSNNVWTDEFSGLTQGFDTFEQFWRFRKADKGHISRDDPTEDMYSAKTTEEVLGWIDDLPDKERPFFVFINYYEPHLPYRPTRPFDDDFLPPDVPKADVIRLRSFYSPREYAYILDVPWMRTRERDVEILTALYDGEISYIDSIIGRLVDSLRERGILDDTLLVITSDHGEHLGENHMLSHVLSVYEPLLRVPLILWNPALVPSGVRVKTLVQAHDVFGTILEFAGVDHDGGRMLPFEDRPTEYAFAELAYPEIFLKVIEKEIAGWDASAFARGLVAVRGERYKLIAGSDGSLELYDLEADPLENTNLADTKPAVLEEMKKALEAFRNGELPLASSAEAPN